MKGILITGLIILLCLAGVLLYKHFTYTETWEDYRIAGLNGDMVTAKRIMLQLADTDPRMQFQRGIQLYTGKGDRGEAIFINKDEALSWFRKSAEQGQPEAQHALGKVYFEGDGIPQDYAEAYFWLNLAASQINAFDELRDKAGANLTPAKREEIQAKCGKWFEELKKRKAANDSSPLIWQDVKVFEWATWWAGVAGVVFVCVGSVGLLLKRRSAE